MWVCRDLFAASELYPNWATPRNRVTKDEGVPVLAKSESKRQKERDRNPAQDEGCTAKNQVSRWSLLKKTLSTPPGIFVRAARK
jgi:hypothetical protein